MCEIGVLEVACSCADEQLQDMQSVDGGDLHKNNSKVKEKHRLTFRQNYFTHLTLLCGAPHIGATHASVAPLALAPQTHPTWPVDAELVTPIRRGSRSGAALAGATL
jgi:hypothetical protein